jgi:MoaA/NifB/PqqE/SkfB family radical SAM enzyme
MELSGFTFIMTDDCNYRCSYCYQKRAKTCLDLRTAKRAADFFRPFLSRECSINFFGGEPLLAADAIKALVHYIQAGNGHPKKEISFSLATNGSLLTDDLVRFLNQHRFSVLLSFDGVSQDVSRKKGSFAPTVAVLRKLLECPDIELETNSVFTPGTIDTLYPSLRFIVESGVPNATISLSNHRPWGSAAFFALRRQLSELRRFLSSLYGETGEMPVTNFHKKPGGVFGCLAGKDRMALSPDGRLWGCCFFYDYSQKKGTPDGLRRCFGSLDSFIRNHRRTYPKTLAAYASLHMRTFWTSRTLCASCPDVDDCVVCPADAAFSSGIIGRIMIQDCRMRKVFRAERTRLWQDLGNRARQTGPARFPASRGRTNA